MSAVCPRCGVPVTPGYVRCPKCRAPLPRRATTSAAGGTAVGGGGRPVMAIAIAGGALVLAVILYFALRGGSKAAATPAQDGSAAAPVTAAPGPAAAPVPTPGPAAPVPGPSARGPTPEAVASELEHALKRKHLWSTVTAVGDHLDVRSGSCRDPGMASELASIAGDGKAAGLLRLRCLEESGTVVMERDF